MWIGILRKSVYPVLTPMAVDSSTARFRLIRNKSLNIAALVRKKKGDGELEFAMVRCRAAPASCHPTEV